jgi:hypothetical protein
MPCHLQHCTQRVQRIAIVIHQQNANGQRTGFFAHHRREMWSGLAPQYRKTHGYLRTLPSTAASYCDVTVV